jgi:hypothetical protein
MKAFRTEMLKNVQIGLALAHKVISSVPHRLVLRHGNKVDVIGHQAITDQLDAVSLNALLAQIEVDRAFLVSLHDEASCIPALGDVMSNIQSNNACESHHFSTNVP